MTTIQVESAEQLKKMPKEYSEILKHMLLAHTKGELSGADAYREGLAFAPNAGELMGLKAPPDHVNRQFM